MFRSRVDKVFRFGSELISALFSEYDWLFDTNGIMQLSKSVGLQWSLWWTWFNFNLSMDMWSYAQLSVGWNYLSIPKLQRCKKILYIKVCYNYYFHRTVKVVFSPVSISSLVCLSATLAIHGFMTLSWQTGHDTLNYLEYLGYIIFSLSDTGSLIFGKILVW